MRYLSQFKLGKKIGLSFGVLMALIVLNAVVVGVAAWSIAQQIGYQQKVAQVFSEVDKVRLTVSGFVNTHSRASAQQVFQQLAITRHHVEAANQALGVAQLKEVSALLDDFKLNFQKYLLESDQKNALESRAFMLGRRLATQLREAQGNPHVRAHRDTLDALEFQLLAFQWGGQARQTTALQTSLRDLESTRQTLARLRDASQPSQVGQALDLLLFRIERDTSDYVTSFEAYLRYLHLNAGTEQTLADISDKIQDDVTRANTTVAQVIQKHIARALGLGVAIFLLSVASAVVLTRYLGRAILRPIRALVDVTHEIATGNLQARAHVGVEDEIGGLARSFNLMAQHLDESRSALLDKQLALTLTLEGMEQRVQERTAELVAANALLTTQMSARARAQAELEATSRTVVARELLLRQIMDTAPVSVFLVDMTGRITQANTSMVEMFGYPMEVLIGMEYVAMVDASELEIGRKKMLALMNSEIPVVDLDRKYRRANGEEFWAHLTGKLFCGSSGERLGLVGVIADITTLKEHEHQLEIMAHFDALTQLPNRLLLADRLHQAMQQCQRKNTTLAVAYLDLDGFKTVNDSHGHDAGDELLVKLALRMKASLREGDTLARIGGDEFVAVLTDLQGVDACKPLLLRLLQAASGAVSVGTHDGLAELQVSASIGVTLFPHDKADADLLMRHADQAMYVAKALGKNRYHMFDVAHDEAIKTQLESLERIRAALGGREFALYYQPKVNMKTGAVTGAEALIRWLHPQRGVLAPAVFLPVIEDQPISIEMGEWVIATALAQMGAWRALGLNLPVSVNISAYQLQQDDFAVRLRELLAEHPEVPADWLQLEVLETSAMEDIFKVSAAMKACQAMGVSFALDDFGTGYSSLTYLKRLPAETLKIDQSFVRDMLDDPGDLAIVHGVIGLARSFGREVIAEGVETRAHGDMLLSTGCDLAQGYGIARPMPAANLSDWVTNWHQGATWTA